MQSRVKSVIQSLEIVLGVFKNLLRMLQTSFKSGSLSVEGKSTVDIFLVYFANGTGEDSTKTAQMLIFIF